MTEVDNVSKYCSVVLEDHKLVLFSSDGRYWILWEQWKKWGSSSWGL